MTRTTVNLARRPAENLRRVWVLWGGGAALLGLLFLALAAVAVTGWTRTRQIKAETDGYHGRMAPLLANSQAAMAPLRQPRIRLELDQSAFLNQLIDRKAVSWTILFERLESILPPEVELVSLRPLERQGSSAVDLRFACDTDEPAIEFVAALQKAPDFAEPRIERLSQSNPTTTPGAREAKTPRFLFEVTALYRPRPQADDAADAGKGQP